MKLTKLDALSQRATATLIDRNVGTNPILKNRFFGQQQQPEFGKIDMNGIRKVRN